MLSLATELAQYPLNGPFDNTADARSRICGSSVSIGLDVLDSSVSRIGLKVAACAVGQSSAAVLASAVKGCTVGQLTGTHQAIRLWLDGEGVVPEWPRFEALAGAKEHKGRHGALILPWDAAIWALSSVSTPVQLSSDVMAR